MHGTSCQYFLMKPFINENDMLLFPALIKTQRPKINVYMMNYETTSALILFLRFYICHFFLLPIFTSKTHTNNDKHTKTHALIESKHKMENTCKHTHKY